MKKRLEEKQKLEKEENDCNFERKKRNRKKRRRKRRNESGMKSDLFVIRFLAIRRENSG